jgi:hypothetical protein
VDQGVHHYEGVTYARTADYRPRLLDLAVPAAEGPVPLVVWIHGGGWLEGDIGITGEAGPIDAVVDWYGVSDLEPLLAAPFLLVHGTKDRSSRTRSAWCWPSGSARSPSSRSRTSTTSSSAHPTCRQSSPARPSSWCVT